MFAKIIKKIGLVTKLDANYFVRNSSIMLSIKIISIFILVLTQFFLIRVLDPVVLGQYNFIISFISVFTIFTLSGMKSATAQSVSKGYDSSLVRGFNYHNKFGIFGVLALFFYSLVLFGQGNPNWYLVAIISPFLVLFISSSRFLDFLGAKKNFKLKSVSENLIVVIPQILVLGVAFSSVSSVKAMVFAFVLSNVGISLGLFYYTIKKYKLHFEERKYVKKDKNFLRFGVHESINEFFTLLTSNFDIVVLGFANRFEELVVYTVALGFIKQVGSLINTPFITLMPKMVHIKKEQFVGVKKKSLYFSLALIPFCMIFFFMIPFLSNLYFTDKYSTASLMIQIMIFGFVPKFVFTVHQVYLKANRMIKEIYKFNVFKLISKVLVYGILVFMYGGLGAAMALVITEFANGIYMYFRVS